MENEYSPYCKICDSCGEDGCCSAVHCQQHPEGSYCKSYLNDLKFGYRMFNSLSNYLDSKGIKFEDEEYDKIYNENWDLTYGK